MPRFLIFIILVILLGCTEEDSEPVYNEGFTITGSEFITGRQDFGADWQPDVSNNGKLIAYEAMYNNEPWLMLLNVETGEKEYLVKGGFNPAWSPDQAWIAFNINSRIYKIKNNGDSLTLLAGEGSSFAPDWSGDGNRIIYDRSIEDQFGPSGTWVMSSSGSNKEFIFHIAFPKFISKTDDVIGLKGVAANTTWKKIFRVDSKSKLLVSELDAVKDQDNRYPELSPDGKRIIFWNPKGIWILNVDGTGLRNVLPWKQIFKVARGDQKGFLVGPSPSWHPDGKHILYQHLRITDYDEPTGLSFGPWYEGVMSLRLLSVE
jgi:Tol biopolymer transport system component